MSLLLELSTAILRNSSSLLAISFFKTEINQTKIASMINAIYLWLNFAVLFQNWKMKVKI